MLVKLTLEGCKILARGSDRRMANVSEARAFALMNGGYANPDHGFMSRFAVSNHVAPVIDDLAILRTPVDGETAAEVEEAAVADTVAADAAGKGQTQGIASEGGAVVGQKKK